MGKEIMSGSPPMDAATAALAIATCDLLVAERAKLTAVLQRFERKGLLTSNEIREVNQSIALLPPELADADSEYLQRKLQERMTARFQEILLHTTAGPDTTQ
jgi:hypothetical protein